MTSLDDKPYFFYPLDRLRHWVAQQGERWFTADEAQAAVGNIGPTQTCKKALLRMARKREVDYDGHDQFRKGVLPKVTLRHLESDGIERTIWLRRAK
jgi:hypothetical protein